MKPLPLILLWLAPWLVSAEESSPPEIPVLEVLPQDILSSRTAHDGKRNVTLQQLDPAAMEDQRLALPPDVLSRPVPAEMVVTAAPDEPVDQRPLRCVSFGASVIIPDKTHPEQAITHLQLWDKDRSVTFWVPGNFLWISGHGDFETATTRYSLLLMVSEGGVDVPETLSLPFAPAEGYTVAAGEPTPEDLSAVRALLDFYQRDAPLLRTQYEARRAQAAAIKAESAANPPEKKNVILRYWRVDEAGIRAAREGGGR